MHAKSIFKRRMSLLARLIGLIDESSCHFTFVRACVLQTSLISGSRSLQFLVVPGTNGLSSLSLSYTHLFQKPIFKIELQLQLHLFFVFLAQLYYIISNVELESKSHLERKCAEKHMLMLLLLLLAHNVLRWCFKRALILINKSTRTHPQYKNLLGQT